MALEDRGPGPSWKWVAIASMTIIGVSGGGWMTYMQAQTTENSRKLEEYNKNSGTQASDIAVIKEKLRVIEERQKESAEASKETNRKLDELLRRGGQERR